MSEMTNQQHLQYLKQGSDVWNTWRVKHPEIRPDFSKVNLDLADLSGSYLCGVDLSEAHLCGTNLGKANLCKADLRHADLSEAYLGCANLSEANLSEAQLSGANLNRVNLSEAFLNGADLFNTTLKGADLSDADLSGAIFVLANLENANFSNATLEYANFASAILTGLDLSNASVGWTHFDNVDLRTVRGLETLDHRGPSHISIDTVYRSQGKISDIFLRKIGTSDAFITYMRSLVNHSIDYYTCFISYSSKDQAFAERLYSDLQSKGVRCWFAPEDMKIGDKIRLRIDESIRMYDKLLLILSKDSVTSDWVEFEVEAAMSKESNRKPTVLFPIRLDDTVLESTSAWADHIKRTRHIGDFICWKNHDEYQKALSRLLRDLKAVSQQM